MSRELNFYFIHLLVSSTNIYWVPRYQALCWEFKGKKRGLCPPGYHSLCRKTETEKEMPVQCRLWRRNASCGAAGLIRLLGGREGSPAFHICIVLSKCLPRESASGPWSFLNWNTRILTITNAVWTLFRCHCFPNPGFFNPHSSPSSRVVLLSLLYFTNKETGAQTEGPITGKKWRQVTASSAHVLKPYHLPREERPSPPLLSLVHLAQLNPCLPGALVAWVAFL